MEPQIFELSTSLSQRLLAKKGGRRRPKQVGIVVVPTGKRTAPLVGAVTVDGDVIASAALDAASAAEFVSQAMIRVNETMPDVRVQVVVETGETQTGPIVPTPPWPPHQPPDEFVEFAQDVFAFQHRRLVRLAAQRPGRGKTLVPSPRKRTGRPDAHAGARRGGARGGAGARRGRGH